MKGLLEWVLSGGWLGLMALIGMGIAWSLIPFIRVYLRPSGRRQLHQTHSTPVCRFGGLAIAISFLIVSCLAWLAFPAPRDEEIGAWTIAFSTLAMFLLGFIDDVWPLGAKRKLLGQILIASCVYFAGLKIGTIQIPFTASGCALGGWSYFVTVFWLIGFTNLINLIDGVDGLAGGISLMVLALLVYLGFSSRLVFTVACAAGVAGALLGFLRFNFPPAKIYLGDGGAYLLGYLIGILSMVQSQKGTVIAALVAPLLVLALPIADVAIAILRRVLQGLPIFRPDRGHLHHRLAEAGLSRVRIVLFFYACSLLFLLVALGIFLSERNWLPFLFGLGSLVLLYAARVFSFRREWFALGKVLGNSLQMRKQTRYAFILSRWLELEAERAFSADHLWIDFGFLARKLGFSRVHLVTPEGNRQWEGVAGSAAPEVGMFKRYDLPGASTLEFFAVEGTDERAFQLLSELAAETWLKAMQRWEQLHRTSLNVGTVCAPGLPASQLALTDGLRE